MKLLKLSLAIALATNLAYADIVDFRIIETTDIHANMMDYDYYKDSYTERFGFTRTASLIRGAQTEVKNSMLVDNGDLIQGSPMADWAYAEREKRTSIHPAHQALNVMKYDVGNIGNHEFNYGLDYLLKTLEGAQFPYINANVFDVKTNKHFFTPYIISNKTVTDREGKPHQIKVGYIGFVPPQVMEWDRNHLEGKVYTIDIVEAAKLFVPEMKSKGADIVIAIPHSGLSTEPYKIMAENSVYYLAEVSDINAILFGHSHGVFPGEKFAGLANIDHINGKVNGVASVMPGQWGDHLGIVDLTLDNSSGKWEVISSKAEARAIYDTVNNKALTSPDNLVRETLAVDFDSTRAYMNKSIGKSSGDLFSSLAVVQDDPTIELINAAQIDYIKYYIQGDPDLDGLPVISAVAPFKAGSRKNDPTAYIEIPKGDLTTKSAADIYVYSNTLAAIKIKGRDIKEWLECSSGVFKQIDITSAQPQSLINWDKFRLYNFDIIDGGISYQIDVTQPARYDGACKIINSASERIQNLTFNGQPINPNQDFVMALNNYRAFTGIFPGSGEDRVVVNSPEPVKDILARYIEKETARNGILQVSVNNNWKISPINSAIKLDIRVETSPTDATKTYIKHYAQQPMEFLHNDDIGYAVYRLNLTK